MKKQLLVLSGLISLVTLMAFSNDDGSGNETMDSSGAPAGYCGDPAGGNKTCNTSGCHTGATVGTITGVITSTIPATGYIPGTTYTVTATFVRPGHTKLGFEISPQKSTGTLLGTLAILTSQTKLVGTSKYITHTATGTAATGGTKTWNFKWTAPAAGQGPVTFYGAFNATNSNAQDTGDSIFKSTLVVSENLTSVNNISLNNISLSTFPNPAHDYLNVKFTLGDPSDVTLEMFSINGSLTNQLINEKEISGDVTRSFDISSYPAGVYFLKFNVNGESSLRKVIKI